MEPAVALDGTPLADYAHEHGLLDSWGIEEPVATGVPRPDGDDFGFTTADRPPPKRLFSGFGPVPLFLTAEAGRARLRRDRFRDLVVRAVRPTVSEAESGQFLEQFRYALVSSDLLDERVNFFRARNPPPPRAGKAPASRRSTGAPGASRNRRSMLIDLPFLPQAPPKYWVGGGGCIIALTTLVTWGIKNGRLPASLDTLRAQGTSGTGAATGPGAGSAAVIVVVLCIVLFLYAHSRRRRLRMLRFHSVALCAKFIDASYGLDSAVAKATSTILQAELLSKGYRLGGAASVGVDSQTMAKHVRASLASTIYLVMSSLWDAIVDLAPRSSQLDLERYLDIYNVKESELDLEVGAGDDLMSWGSIIGSPDDYYGANGSSASVPTLKREFAKLHLLRRSLMCILLSMPSAGTCSGTEIGSWAAVVDHVDSISTLMEQLTSALSRQTSPPQFPLYDDTITTTNHPNSHTNDIRTHARSLHQVSAALNNLNGHIHVLGEAVDVDDDRLYFRTFQSMGTEIQMLLDSWQRGFRNLEPTETETEADQEAPLQQDDDDDVARPPSPEMESFDDTFAGQVDAELDQEFEASGRYRHNRISTITLATTIAESSDDPIERSHSRAMSTTSNSTVIQGVADDDKVPARSSLSRADRIKLMNTERAERASQSHRQHFITELNSVLRNRV